MGGSVLRLTGWQIRLKLSAWQACRGLRGAVASLLNRLFGKRRSADPVVVVSGLPRSGTSMLMGMLAAGGLPLVTDGVRRADTDNPNGYYELEQVKELDKATDRSWLGDARGKGLKVISFLLQHLPDTYDYKILFVNRSLPEVLASQKKMLQRRGEAPGEADDDEMATLFEAHLRKVETQLASRPNCDVLYVEHRETLNAPGKVADEINRFLGDRLDVEAMTQVVDEQLYRNKAEM